MNEVAAAAAAGLALIALILIIRWRWNRSKQPTQTNLPYTPVHLVHRLCPHNNVVQGFEVDKKDSLDEHLDALTRKLAEKEGRLHMSKYKIRETQDEIQNLQAIDNDVRTRYRELMDSLRSDLRTNEKECKKLQEQIEWVSRRRAELRDEVHQGQKLYGAAAMELATNLAELQRGRDPKITDKPQRASSCSIRARKEPNLPRGSPICTSIIKSPRHSIESIDIYGPMNF